MKQMILAVLVGWMIAGCSESPEQAGEELSDRMKAPLEKARAVSEQAAPSRNPDVPE